MKKNIKLTVFLVIIIALISLITVKTIERFSLQTFSRYNSSGTSTSAFEIAVPIFEDTVEEVLIAPLDSMSPNQTEIYTFSVTNYNAFNEVTDTTMNYSILIETSNYLPLTYELQKETNILGEYENVPLTNGLSSTFSLPHTTATTHNYKLIINWDGENDTHDYAKIVEVITLTIDAEQKVS